MVYPYDYMDDWEKFNETTLSEKEELSNNLNMEDIVDADYMHLKRLWYGTLGEHHDFILEWHITFGWYFQKLQKNVFKNLSFRS